jgi:hypothetical protein
MSKIGFVYGWGDELCENIRKKLAVIKWQPFIFSYISVPL